MARKGSRKVRTGCITCKIRKVKCDENKPACNRCLTTGRKCDGYQQTTEPPPLLTKPGRLKLSTNYLNRTFPGVSPCNDDEGRALQYFCETVGPFLSGAVDPYFWTHIVMQFSTFEPSVRHSLVAISNLYEHIEVQDQASIHLPDRSFALRHYNAAINELKAIDSQEKQPIVLIACVLFICIEFLQSNRAAAVRHCKHGIAILRSIGHNISWTEEHLLPLFRRLSELSFYFGEKSDCSDLAGLERPIPVFFTTHHEAQLMIDDIYARTYHLMKLLDPYRSGLQRGEPAGDEVLAERDYINHLLDVWHELFTSFSYRVLYTTATKATGDESQNRQKILRGFLITRYECCRIWLNIALNGDECGFDQYVNNFKRVAKVLRTIVADVSQHMGLKNIAALSSKFVFETGFTPMLFSIVATCRHLETRLQILQLMPLLGLPRENLWEMDTMFAVGRRMVEIEHSISIDDYGRCLDTPSTSWPPKRRRVLDVSIDPKTEHRKIQGQAVTGKIVEFHRRNTEGGVDTHAEFVIIRKSHTKEAGAWEAPAVYTDGSHHSESPELMKSPCNESSSNGTAGPAEDWRLAEPKAPIKSVAGPYAWDIEPIKTT